MSRRLDAAIERRLFREKIIPIEQYSFCSDGHGRADDWDEWHKVPHYSTDGNAMLHLIQEMKNRGWRFSAIDNTVKLRKDGFAHAAVGTLPLAVSLIAYEILAEREWGQNNGRS